MVDSATIVDGGDVGKKAMQEVATTVSGDAEMKEEEAVVSYLG